MARLTARGLAERLQRPTRSVRAGVQAGAMRGVRMPMAGLVSRELSSTMSILILFALAGASPTTSPRQPGGGSQL
jgi:hypothetical protein